jgi:hypothetical protein
LRDNQYCILNKQYTKEEYEALLPKVIAHMNEMPYVDKQGREYRFGEFFPMDLCPFAYNETPAQDFFPKTKEQALSQGFTWRDKEKSMYTVTLKNAEIPDNIADVSDAILNEIIECGDSDKEYSPGAFRIIPTELALYRKLGIPLPRKSPNVRYYDQMAFNNPFTLYRRQCMCDRNSHGHEGICPNMFETTYAVNRPEIVYCEQCYQKEVV